MNPKIAEGIRLFNSRKYFEAHEALEEVWLRAEGKTKVFLHGLIQVAAAFHHHSRGNAAGFRSLLEKGMNKLRLFEDGAEGIELKTLLAQLGHWCEHLEADSFTASSRPPRLPHIEEMKAQPLGRQRATHD